MPSGATDVRGLAMLSWLRVAGALTLTVAAMGTPLMAGPVLAESPRAPQAPAGLPLDAMGERGEDLAPRPFATLDTPAPWSVSAQAAEGPTRVSRLSAANRVVVTFRKGATEAERQELRRRAGVVEVSTAELLPNSEFWELAPARLRAAGATKALAASPEVARVEADPIRTLSEAVVPNDPAFEWNGMTGLRNIKAPEAWSVTTGSPDVVVAVIDSGVDMSHPDLRANIWTNEAEANGRPGYDDDGNGYVDDVHGWDFVNNDNDPSDDNGHGTHVAGTIAAEGNNGIGVPGVSWSSKVMPLKVCDAGSVCYMSDALRALDYAVANGARISNNSYGGKVPSSGIEQEMIARAGAKGHLFVTAAGNEFTDLEETPAYPAAYPQDNIVSVAAAHGNDTDELAIFSNFGWESVDLVAPGQWIKSTTMGGDYGFMSGTSMASPHVAGVAALIASVWPEDRPWDASEIRERLMRSTLVPAKGPLRTASGGFLDAEAAVHLDWDLPKVATVVLQGSGRGVVTGPGVVCNHEACAVRLGQDATTAQLRAEPEDGDSFAEWRGGCTDQGGECTLPMSGLATTVYANFRGHVAEGFSAQQILGTSEAVPSYVADFPWSGSSVQTKLSGDGSTRAVARFVRPESGYCNVTTDTTISITVEKNFNGEWFEWGEPIRIPETPTAIATIRWFGCASWWPVAISDDGNTLVVSLGSSWMESACASAVYTLEGMTWKGPVFLTPHNPADCYLPKWDPNVTMSNWSTTKISADGNRIVAMGFDSATVFDRIKGGWYRTGFVPLSSISSQHAALSGGGFALSGDGKTIAVSLTNDARLKWGQENDIYVYGGRVVVMREGENGWSVDLNVTPDDEDTVGTQDLGTAIALDHDGDTLVASYGRTWETLWGGTNFVGGAWIYERSGDGWRRVKTIENRLTDRGSDFGFGGLRCPGLSADGTTIACVVSGTSWGGNRQQGWAEVIERVGESWDGEVARSVFYDVDGRTSDFLDFMSGTSDLSTIYFGWPGTSNARAHGDHALGVQLSRAPLEPKVDIEAVKTRQGGATIELTGLTEGRSVRGAVTGPAADRVEVAQGPNGIEVRGLQPGETASVELIEVRGLREVAIGTVIVGAALEPAPDPVPAPEPAPTPVPTPAPTPSPAPVPASSSIEPAKRSVKARITTLRGRLSDDRYKPPVVSVKGGKPVSIRVRGLPKREVAYVTYRVTRGWAWLGKVRVDSTGTLLLPAVIVRGPAMQTLKVTLGDTSRFFVGVKAR